MNKLRYSPKNTISPNQQQDHKYIQDSHHQIQIYTNPTTPPITKYKYPQKHKNGDHSQQWLNNILNLTSK